MTAESQAPDRTAAVIRAVLSPRPLVVGALSGLAIVGLTGGILLLLGLIPNDAWRAAIGAGGFDSLSGRGRLASGLLGGWPGEIEYDYGEADVAQRIRAMLVLPTFVAAAVIGLIGLVARRRVPGELLPRLAALVSAALAAAVAIAVLAMTLGYREDQGDFVLAVSYNTGSYLVGAFVFVLLLGVFSFGVVGSWPARLRVPAKGAGLVLAIVLVVAIAAVPFLLAVPEPRDGEFDPGFSDELVGASIWAPGAATATEALPFGAPAHLGTNEDVSPFGLGFEDDQPTWAGLAEFAREHEHARIGGYASAGGALWKLGVFGVATAVLALWILAALGVVRRLGAARPVDGLRSGALVGAFGGALLIAWSWLFALEVTVHFSDDAGATIDVFWGTTVTDALWATLGLVVVTGIAGAVYAAFRPSPLRGGDDNQD